MAATFLTANWKDLVMANYIIDPTILEPFVPIRTELDSFNGQVYVSLVGFMFTDTRLLGWRIPFHVHFEEVNLRFYVRHKDAGQWKRGTVFIKEIVPKPAISFVANTIYHEKYATHPMNHFLQEEEDFRSLGYSWKHKGRWNRMEAVTEKHASPMPPGSETEFIAEHYWGYSRYNAATTFEYNVQHPAWRVYKVNKYVVDCDFAGMYGKSLYVLDTATPNSVFVAEGSAVSVLKKRRL